MFIVYRIANRINGKCYIGISSRALNVRWSEHLERHRQGVRKGNRLYAALSKYGPEAFDREVIATAETEAEIRRLETVYIVKFNSYHKGYNCNLGGNGFLEFPEHIKRKISEAQKGKVISPEAREKMSRAKMGDKSCAANFGAHTQKGKANPRAGRYLIKFPDGSEHQISGILEFCRQHNIAYCKLSSRGKTKGYVLLKRFNDYPEREYTQAGGNGGSPVAVQD